MVTNYSDLLKDQRNNKNSENDAKIKAKEEDAYREVDRNSTKIALFAVVVTVVIIEMIFPFVLGCKWNCKLKNKSL